ncbi:MAG: hypothetical protein IT223_06770 [Crocinitomicaceae bacterium]|nr:hypothetical protein [Crocinitomicaceae bacterium]
MKQNLIYSILAICFALVGFSASAQGTLQFNQVKLVSTVQTVPTGKVWKAVGVAGNRVTKFRAVTTTDADYSPAATEIKINNTAVSVAQTIGTGAGGGTGYGAYSAAFAYSASPTNFPLWLPAGTTLEVSTNISYISVIEFNIVP